MMGSYYDADKVEAEAQKVIYTVNDKPIGVPADTRLIMVLNNGFRKMAVDVTKPDEWNEFYRQYAAGHWLTMDLYAYPVEERDALR